MGFTHIVCSISYFIGKYKFVIPTSYYYYKLQQYTNYNANAQLGISGTHNAFQSYWEHVTEFGHIQGTKQIVFNSKQQISYVVWYSKTATHFWNGNALEMRLPKNLEVGQHDTHTLCYLSNSTLYWNMEKKHYK